MNSNEKYTDEYVLECLKEIAKISKSLATSIEQDSILDAFDELMSGELKGTIVEGWFKSTISQIASLLDHIDVRR